MEYRPREYWDHRGRTYLRDFHFLKSLSGAREYLLCRPILKRLIKAQLEDIEPRSLLEVGCGPGRLFDLYEGMPDVHCVDISPVMLERAEDLAKRRGYDNITLHEMRAERLDFEDGRFDVVLTSNVLLHIPYDTIEEAISELVRVSGRWVLSVEYYVDDLERERRRLEELQRNMMAFCFLHNYPEIFERKNARLWKETGAPLSRQKLFLFRVV